MIFHAEIFPQNLGRFCLDKIERLFYTVFIEKRKKSVKDAKKFDTFKCSKAFRLHKPPRKSPAVYALTAYVLQTKPGEFLQQKAETEDRSRIDLLHLLKNPAVSKLHTVSPDPLSPLHRRLMV